MSLYNGKSQLFRRGTCVYNVYCIVRAYNSVCVLCVYCVYSVYIVWCVYTVYVLCVYTVCVLCVYTVCILCVYCVYTVCVVCTQCPAMNAEPCIMCTVFCGGLSVSSVFLHPTRRQLTEPVEYTHQLTFNSQLMQRLCH